MTTYPHRRNRSSHERPPIGIVEIALLVGDDQPHLWPMLSFDRLTPRGQARRLRALALATLKNHYGIAEPRRVRLLSMHSFNTVFRVDTAHETSVLRVGDAVRIHGAGVEDVEACWLDSLAKADLVQLANIPATSRARWVTVSHPDVPESRVCTRFSWVAGTELRGRADAHAMTTAGRLLARLHDHAEEFTWPTAPPESLHARTAIYFGSEDMVANYRSTHGSLFVEATARVQELIDGLWASGASPHLLHGDFGPHNLLSSRGRLQPIDFQDLQIGFAVQDIGITISDLGRSTPEFVEPFLDGYRAVRALPELSPNTVATLAAARSLNIMNLALVSPQSGISAGFGSQANRIVRWMQPGD